MGQVVFNFHDLILVMTAFQCCFFALLIALSNSKRSASDFYLAGFLFVLAFIPIHELIMWGYVFKIKVRESFPDAYFITGFAYYIDTVLLYFYIKSLVFKDFKLKYSDCKHFIPLGVFALYLLVFFYAKPASERLAMINDESFAYSWMYISMDFLCKCLRVVNCIFCLLAIKKYQDILESTRSRVEGVSIIWLQILVVGFLCVTVVELSLSLAKCIGVLTTPNVKLFEFLGLSGYYIFFIVVNLLVFSSIRFFSAVEAVRRSGAVQPTDEDLLICQAYAEKVDCAMRAQKYYLDPEITLDALAEKLAMPARHLSITINRHYQKNFYEFINHYRIGEAKRLLRDPNNTQTITDIYLAVGFNSKSVFNTFFKKVVSQTPTQYRKSQA